MFFLRRYNSGKAQSGTTDIASWEEFPPYEEFRAVCESFGEGKYIMFERGKGIRGMRKVNEYVVEPKQNFASQSSSTTSNSLEKILVFAAEEFGVEPEAILSVKQKIPIGDMTDDDLVSALDQITKSAEGEDSLSRDVKAIIDELKSRTLGAETVKAAETTSMLGGKMGFGAGMLVGGLGGVAATAYHYRGKDSRHGNKNGGYGSLYERNRNGIEERSGEQKETRKASRSGSSF